MSLGFFSVVSSEQIRTPGLSTTENGEGEESKGGDLEYCLVCFDQ